MREGWREVRLGDVATRRSDFTPVRADEFYRIVGVQRSGWGLVDREPARGDSMKFEKLMELHTDDLVYRTITAFEAPSSVVATGFQQSFVTPQTFPVYVLDRTQILPSYMALLTTWPMFHEEMSTRCVGTVLRRKTLSKGAFESIPISLPPIGEQHRIVDLIAAVDAAVEAADAEIAASSNAEMAIANGVRGEPTNVGLLLSRIEAGSSPRALSRPPVGGEKGVLKVSAIGDSGFEPTESKALPESTTMPERALVRSGDLLMTRASGAMDRVGITCLVTTSTDNLYLSDKTLRLVPDPARASAVWLNTMLRTDNARKQITALATGSDMRNLSQERTRLISLPTPNLEIQTSQAAAFIELRSSANAARATVEALRTLRSNLLTVLLSGEHEIPASYDQFLNLDEEAAA